MPKSRRGLIHLHGNILCAIDTETTGLVAGYHDIWQVCILPLDCNFEPNKDVIPFYMDIKVKNPERINKRAIALSKGNFASKQVRAIDPWTCADLLDDWFVKLDLPLGKKIVPVAQNWPFDRGFLLEWLGAETFNDLFSYRYRDTMVTAAFLSDAADYHFNPLPFQGISLAALCTHYGITNQKAHDSLQDCIVTAQIYQRMLAEVIS